MTDKYHERRMARMDMVDSMTAPLRNLVHEHGLTVVKAFLDLGVSNPRHIQHLITTVQKGSVEIGNRTHSPNLGSLHQ